MRSSILTALLCLPLLAAQSQEKKQTQKPAEADDVVRVTTELVQTDVMVFDNRGRFVSDLKPDQFELFVDGARQPVMFFESVMTGGRSEERALRAARGDKSSQPAVDSEPATSDRGRTVLFFINDLHLAPGSLARTHKTITHYIDHMLGPNDQVAITSASGQIGFLQQLTDNPVVLRAAIERLKFVHGTSQDGERPPMSEYAAFLIAERNDRQLFDYFVEQTIKANNVDRSIAAAMVERRARAIVRNADFVIKNSLTSLANLIAATVKLPGRKLVFFISDGFLPNFTGSDFTATMRRATDSAAASGVVIYSLDAAGLATDSSLDASHSGGFDPTGVLQSRLGSERTFLQEPLHALAADTGGRALFNSNAFDEGIARVLEETSRYYLLAWRPESSAQRAPNFPKIKITIAGRPDLKVQVRRGYLGPPPEQSKARVAPAPVNVESPDVLGVTESSTDELRAALYLGYKQASANKMQLTSAIQVSAQSPEQRSGTVDTDVLAAVFDSRGKAVGSFKRRVEVPRSGAQGVPAYIFLNHSVDVEPGLYQVRVVAREKTSGRLNSAMEWIEIPKLKQGTFSISSLYIGEIADAGVATQVGVNASRRFARSSRLRFTTYIYNAKGSPPQLTAQIKVLGGNQTVLAPPEIKISTEKQTSNTNITYAGEFPLNSLPAGSYVLQLTVNDKTSAASALQQFKFVVY